MALNLTYIITVSIPSKAGHVFGHFMVQTLVKHEELSQSLPKQVMFSDSEQKKEVGGIPLVSIPSKAGHVFGQRHLKLQYYQVVVKAKTVRPIFEPHFYFRILLKFYFEILNMYRFQSVI